MKKSIKAIIGASYQYYGSKNIYKLVEIDRYIYRFECGHWCTDSVFIDLFQVTLF